MSVVTYSGLTLPYANITQFRQEAIYDESNTDRCYTKFDISVQAVINSEYLSLLNSQLVNPAGDPVTKQTTTDNAAEIMKAVRQQLLQQRQQLSVTFNGVELIPQNPNQHGLVDARNGPQPQSCIITQLTNVTFLITFHIIAHFWEDPIVDNEGNVIVPSTNDQGNSVLYNRWTEIAEIDNTNTTTYTRQGKYVIRSDNFDRAIADSLRTQMATIAPYRGFLRETSQYKVSPDGLAMEYLIRDREQFKMPPPPAFQAEGEYLETATTPSLSWRSGMVRIRLKGDIITPQATLLNLAVAIAAQKLALALQVPMNTPITKIGIPHNASARVNLYENEVEVSLQCMFQTSPERTKGLNCFFGLNTFTPFSEGNIPSPNYLPHGTGAILLHAARYFDPNLANTKLNDNGQLQVGREPGTAGIFPEIPGT